MKQAKRFFGLLLVMILSLALATTAFAQQEGTITGGSITIKDAVSGHTYKIYQLLYLEGYDKTSNAYAYKANSAWESWLRTQTSYLTFDAQGYVTWVDGANAADFAKLAQAKAAEISITADGSVEASSATVTFTDLKLGYYLVDTTLGTLCSLDTTDPDVTMEEKNEAPENVKTVQEDSTNQYGQSNDADIGDTVNFKSTITAKEGAENYVFHDTMSTGLTYTNVTGITWKGETLDEKYYTVVTDGLSDDCTFEVRFAKEFCDLLMSDDEIVISYTAVLNENAVVAGDGNINKSKLTYGDASKTKSTPDSETKTYTWDVDVYKYAQENEKKEPLAGAEFSLSKNSTGESYINLIKLSETEYRVAKAGEAGTVNTITTGNTGKFTIKGLDADTYYLFETKAPAGYNRLSGPITITIGENGVVNKTGDQPGGVDEVDVLNQSGTELPSTGGIGTTIFYVMGSALALGALVLLVAKKRMNKN